MTRQEVKKLMAVIRAAWPGFYKDADAGTLRAATEIWAVALEPLRYEDAGRALGLLARELKYPPTAAEVWQAAFRLRPQLPIRPVPVFRLPDKEEKNETDVGKN